jgi:hypothetical protein
MTLRGDCLTLNKALLQRHSGWTTFPVEFSQTLFNLTRIQAMAVGVQTRRGFVALHDANAIGTAGYCLQ